MTAGKLQVAPKKHRHSTLLLFLNPPNIYPSMHKVGETFIISKRQTSSMRTLSAVIVKEEGMYVASCPEVGTVSQGRTVKSALKNLKEATSLYLEESSA